MQSVDRKNASWKKNERDDDEKRNKKKKIRDGRNLERDRAHELRLMSITRDFDKVKKEETEKLLDRQKKLVSIPKWTDDE